MTVANMACRNATYGNRYYGTRKKPGLSELPSCARGASFKRLDDRVGDFAVLIVSFHVDAHPTHCPRHRLH
jgi:hypothetical protein